MAVIMLCCTAGAAAGQASADARLQEAQTAFDEATKLKDAGSYSEALAQAEQALTLREAVLGGTHPEVANCLHLLGDIHRRRGDLARAEPLLQRALTLREAALGKDHLSVASSVNNLAILYSAQGLYERAAPLFERALAINEAAPGDNHARIAASLNNLANHYESMGLAGQAEPLLRRALALYEATPGTPPFLVAYPLNNLAKLYLSQGAYGQAESLFQRALAVNEAASGPNHPDVAISLSNLAVLYAEQELYDDRTQSLYQRSLAIREAALGPDHPDVAYSLNNLASFYKKQGLYSRARPLYQRALAIREAALGPQHLDVAVSLNSLAALYMEQGQYSRAEPLLHRTLAISDAAPDKYNLNTQFAVLNLAILRVAQRRLDDALPLFTRAFAVMEQRLRREALGFSESRLVSFLQHLRVIEQLFYALLREHPKDARVRRLALGAVLLLKGRSVEETANISRTLHRSLGTEERGTLERLRGLRTQLATLSHAGPGSLAPADYQQRLQTLIAEGDALEADLARRSAPLRALTALPSTAEIVDRVAASLPQDSALVEFIAYKDSPVASKPGKTPSQLRYLALVLFPDGSTQALDLGPAAAIDAAATRLRDELARRDARFLPSAQALHRLAFQPLRPLLGTTRRIFLSPDGQLGLVPFAALHDGRRFLLDSFDFTYLTSGKELLPRPQELPPATSVFVLADPDFNASRRTAPTASAVPPELAERSAALERFFSTRSADLATTPWLPLPGTRKEAESIQRLLPQAQLFLGPEATKERLLQLATPGILHLATHGFFLEDAPVPKNSRAVSHFGALGDNAFVPRPPDPLLRSGLILSSARAPAPDVSPPPDAALVTALELAGLNLWGTQLVILSACDTGRGDVKLGQGVYGLRRALVVAGAETVVMSLWKVNDETTQALMERYYRNLLEGQGRATALREAMRSLRLSEVHPHYWAPFIAVGSDAPLRAIAPPSP
ncbi:hypothetical protein Q664_48675 [Archangium violaceum Cb vi76]|uniref:CHAT domain-containing protein n=2 Tax=Archangium violaceum TaxID=83451 RepID=A0A084SFT9_9BACT|nr:hypothetical protein Q664_48675 [Archangium violaceum Cb vi76]